MAISTGFDTLVPKYILGTDWNGSIAKQVIGSQFYKQCQLARIFPFYGFGASNVISVPRVTTPPTAAFLGNSSADTDDSAPTLAAPALEFFMTSIVGDVRLTDFAIDVNSRAIDQEQLQRDLKKLAAEIAFWEQFFKNQVGQGFQGVTQLVDATQRIEPGPNGGALTLQLMDNLVALVTEAMGEMDKKFILMNTASFLKYVGLVRATGAELQYKTINGMEYCKHNGVGILICDYIPNNETLGTGTGLTSVYCCTLGYQNGGLFGAYPPGVGNEGWVIEKVQEENRKDVCVYRVKFYTTLVLTLIKGLAQLRGILN